ncbi:F0F1 ATP synthase subunit A [Varibaculum vaginae]|uniref:F0F1 ATP synthase subunit A n=1 Tax=Varibaculum vaginae TaxID=2364797 RepID=UPI000F098127|nr:F0F1 ATP synthase subunit A [Varibaculum vaginae]
MLSGLNNLLPQGGFEAPTIDEFFPPIIAFAGTPFEMNRITLVRIVLLLAFLVCAMLYTRRAKMVPGAAQSTMEYLLDFCRVNISEQVMGKEYARQYNGFVTAIFFTVLFMNIGGIIPGLNIAGSAVAGIPLLLAVFVWFLFIIAGIRAQGFGGYFKSSLFIPNVPKVLYILLTPIEFFSTFLVRPFTLFVRLLANMIAGHMLLALTMLASNYFLLTAAGGLKIVSAVTFIAAIAVTLFEIFVAFLQAYVFAVLTAVYVEQSVHSH